MTAQYLLDTNHFSAYWKDQQPISGRLADEPTSNIALSLPSVGELWFMIFNSGRVALKRRRLVRLLQPMTLLDFDQSAALEFVRWSSGASKRSFSAAGRSFPMSTRRSPPSHGPVGLS